MLSKALCNRIYRALVFLFFIRILKFRDRLVHVFALLSVPFESILIEPPDDSSVRAEQVSFFVILIHLSSG